MTKEEHLPWPEKHRPESMEELVGNSECLKELRLWIESWKRGKPSSQSVLLVGPPGTGKTASVGALAKDMELELVEFNASDKRNKASIETLVWRSASQQTLDGSMRLILLDEVDGLSGTSDRGGVGAILKIIENTVHPIIMTANDPESPRLKNILKQSRVFVFSPINSEDIQIVLQRIAKKQGIKIPEEDIEDIAMSASGDLRAAIADLEMMSKGGFRDSDKAHRDVRRNIQETLRRLFMAPDTTTAKRILSDSDVDHDQLLLWIEENIHLHRLSPIELEKSLEAISQADLYLGRIWRGPNWRLLAYVYDLLATGIPSSRLKTPFRPVEYSQPSWPLLVWRGNMSRQKQTILVSRLAREAHVSKSRVFRSHLETINQLLDKSPVKEKEFTEWLGLKKGAFGRRGNPRSRNSRY